MKTTTMLVLSDPREPQLSMLAALSDHANVVIGNSAEAFADVALDAAIILNWSGSLGLLRDVFRMSPRLRWMHSRAAGLEQTLFPELVTSNVILTNGSGVFSPSLGEFVLGAILYFAKGFRRMIRNQMAGRWNPFDVEMISGRTVGIVGYGDIGRAVASRVRAMDMKVLAIKRHVSSKNSSDPLVDQMYGPDGRIEMISLCDYIVAAAPLNAETRGLIGAPEFAAMKKTAVVINVGRGQTKRNCLLNHALGFRSVALRRSGGNNSQQFFVARDQVTIFIQIANNQLCRLAHFRTSRNRTKLPHQVVSQSAWF